jgi:hypothetical protein
LCKVLDNITSGGHSPIGKGINSMD